MIEANLGSHRYWVRRRDIDGNTVEVPVSMEEWANALENERIIAQDIIGPLFVSTVFLGLNHQFADKNPPLLYETMVFTNFLSISEDIYMERYTTNSQAIHGHARALMYGRFAGIYSLWNSKLSLTHKLLLLFTILVCSPKKVKHE